ncbi:iron-siderophore ABC transporter substrate-binding protein [Rivularia sp. UHCC 0363]|uniref:ABC transporter substrate-binding protein n=1 Tax=Rivularia sp. UHCC 0363 TaxID=3110244 RepID=UPI002B1F7F4C|nr:iron-siderophore ABC transporter substrate-binding protein [Rivularia sp. UHCC 0363]MEA5598169.1 iron-siderophore ABC transporter substrate-binding protein [Rivularia sp. UHCC 0363]
MNKYSRRFFLTAMMSVAVACGNNSAVSPTDKSISAKTPSRVVALEWVYVEDLLALGIQPVGVADIEGYQKFVNIEPQLAASVVDVGTRAEPNLEAIAQLKPDLIISVELRHQVIYDTLSSIASTLLFNAYPSADSVNQLQEMQQTFIKIADTMKRGEQGRAILEKMQATFKQAEKQLSDLKIANKKFILGQFSDSAPQLRLFTDNAMAVQIIKKIGLENAWQGKFDAFGFNTVWIEALPKVEAANFIYITTDSNIYWQQLQNNPVWKGLKFVQENRVYPIASDTWVFGGPLSAEILVNKIVNAFGGKMKDKG